MPTIGKRFLTRTQTSWKKVLPWIVLLGIFLANALELKYPDEFDNLLGGRLILLGKLPYVGFFSHHGPLSYFLAALIELFSGNSFVRFRLVSALFFLGLFGSYFLLFQKKLVRFKRSSFWLLAFLLAIAAPIFWGQMFLADVLSGFLILPAYLLVFHRVYFQEKLTHSDFWIISLAVGLCLINSLTYLYAGIVIYLVLAVYQLKTVNRTLKPEEIIREYAWEMLILLAPYLVFFGYLILTRSFTSFYDEAVVYNQKYYIYNYPRPPGGSWQINPIRYAIVLFTDFFVNIQLALGGIFKFDPNSPLTHTFAVTNAIFISWLVYKKRFLAVVLVLFSLVYVSARGNPASIRKTDYQTAVYMILSIVNFVLASYFLLTDLEFEKNPVLKTAFSVLALVLGVFWLFGGMYLFSENWQTMYQRYMGQAPLIYDRPLIAPILNAVLSKNDYCWVGPFEFEEMFYLQCRLPSKFNWILPQFAEIPQYQEEILANYNATMPKIIVYQRTYSVFGATSEYGRFFMNFLDTRYHLLADFPQFKNYRFRDATLGDFHPDIDFNFERSRANATIESLIKLDYIVLK